LGDFAPKVFHADGFRGIAVHAGGEAAFAIAGHGVCGKANDGDVAAAAASAFFFACRTRKIACDTKNNEIIGVQALFDNSTL